MDRIVPSSFPQKEVCTKPGQFDRQWMTVELLGVTVSITLRSLRVFWNIYGDQLWRWYRGIRMIADGPIGLEHCPVLS